MSKKTFKILLTTRHKRVHSGSTIQLYLLAKELVKRGHRVQALVNGERGKPLRDSLLPLEQAGVKVEKGILDLRFSIAPGWTSKSKIENVHSVPVW